MTVLLSAEGLTKNFGGLTAVDHVDLDVREGEIRGLIGPNGSGKTTLINLITGFYRPDSGGVIFGGQAYKSWSMHQIARQGISRTFQTIRLFKQMTVLENIITGLYMRANKANMAHVLLGFSKAICEEQWMRLQAMEHLEEVGLPREMASNYAGNLPYSQQRLVEIARALATKPRLLVLDEPAAGMNPTEITDLTNRLRSFAAAGMSLLLIEHRMGVVMPLSNRVAVLNFGKKIADGIPVEIQRNPEVLQAYLGRQNHNA